MGTLGSVIQRGTSGAQPAATTVPVGTLYFQTDTGVTQRSNGTTWDSYSSSGSSSTVPSTVQGDTLYASGTNVLAALAKNTSATRYLSNTGTTNNPAWAQVNLANGVTGVLPVANGGTGVSSGFVALLRTTTTINDAGIKALFHPTPVTLVSAPSAGTRIRPFALSFSVNTTAGLYTHLNASYVDLHTTPTYGFYGVINDSSVDPALTVITTMLGTAAHTVYDITFPNQTAIGTKLTITGATPSPADTLAANGSSLYTQNVEINVAADVDGVALALVGDNSGDGDLTGGHAANTMIVTVYYVLEPL